VQENQREGKLGWTEAQDDLHPGGLCPALQLKDEKRHVAVIFPLRSEHLFTKI
jgi:hypothetical protein